MSPSPPYSGERGWGEGVQQTCNRLKPSPPTGLPAPPHHCMMTCTIGKEAGAMVKLANLHGQQRHDADRSARGRGDVALFHRALRQRRQPPPRLRLESGGSRRAGPRPGCRPDRCQPPRKSSSPAAPPRATTSPSRAWRRCIATRAITSSRSSPSTRRSSIRASGWSATASASPSCRWTAIGRVSAEQVARGPHRQDDPGQHHGGQQRDRHAAADRGNRQAVQGARRALSTPTRCRRSARCRSTWRRWASIC